MDRELFVLTKISDNENALRTKQTVGNFLLEPKVGESFRFYAEPLEKLASLRMITTSVVQKVWEDQGTMYFDTLNSTYCLRNYKV